MLRPPAFFCFGRILQQLISTPTAPEASIWRFEDQNTVPVEPTPENIVVLWVSGYTWSDEAACEALQRVVPVVQRHLFLQPT